MKKIIVVFLLALFLLLSGCDFLTGPEGPEGISGEINYWVHEIQDVIFVDPYYQVTVWDDRIGTDYWIDVWKVAVNGALYHPVPVWDNENLVWYDIIYIYVGALTYRAYFDETGWELFIFYAPVGTRGLDQFDAQKYFDLKVR